VIPFILGLVFGFVLAWCIHKLVEYEQYLNSEEKKHDDWKRS